MERDAKSFKFNGRLISIFFEFNLMRKAMHIILHGFKDLLEKNNAFILSFKCRNRQFITLLTLNKLRQVIEPSKKLNKLKKFIRKTLNLNINNFQIYILKIFDQKRKKEIIF
jgi:hypothetical protein